MMKYLFTFVTALLCLKLVVAQGKQDIRIVVSDTFKNERKINASISILRASDSILLNSGRTDERGSYGLYLGDTGKFILKVYYPGYEDYRRSIFVINKKEINEYFISLLPIAHLLADVVVRNEVMKVKIRADTIEFRADSFATDLNASVEDLLKKLPGVTVDQNGNITAYGKRVQKILLGGEEYFSEDPTLVTRSLRSNMIEKVQVFDKKSDQAVFSMINDGKSVKAINLELKKDKKRAYFGKLKLGSNFGSFYNNQILMNRFNNDQKIAFYIIHANLGTTGLSWQETQKYSDFSLTDKESSGFMTSQISPLENWDGTYQNQGIPIVTSIGLQYNDRLNENFKVNGNYRSHNIALNIHSICEESFQVNSQQYLRLQNSTVSNRANTNRGLLKFKIPFSANNDLMISLDMSSNFKDIHNHKTSKFYLDKKNLLNTQTRTLDINGSEKNFNINILWRKRFKNLSTLSLNTKALSNKSMFNGFLNSKDSIFQNNQFFRDTLTDQFKADAFKNRTYFFKGIFSIPLNVFSALSISSTFTHNKSANNLRSNNKNGNNIYNLTDSIHSIVYELMGNNTMVGIGYNYSNRKILITAMFDGGISDFTQKVEDKLPFRKSYLLLFPTATLTYSFSAQHKLIFDYTGTTTLPQITKIQPVINNIDPLYQMIGNPMLSTAFRNTMQLQYYKFVTAKDVYFSGGCVFSFEHNAFSTKEELDIFGKRIFSTINVSGNKSLLFFSNYSLKPFKKLFDLNLSAKINAYQNTKFLNNTELLTKVVDYELSIAPFFYRENKINILCTASFNWSNIFSYTPILERQHYSFLRLEPSISVNVFKYTVIKSDYFNSLYRYSLSFGEERSISMLNLSLSQYLFRDKTLAIQFYIRDLFNTNSGLIRSTHDNYLTQTSFNTITQYFLISGTYNFSKTIKQK